MSVNPTMTDLVDHLVKCQKKKKKSPEQVLFIMKSIGDRKLEECPLPADVFPHEPEKVRIVNDWLNKIQAYNCFTYENNRERITYACYLHKYLTLGFLEEPFLKAPNAGKLNMKVLCMRGNLLKFQRTMHDLEHLLSIIENNNN